MVHFREYRILLGLLDRLNLKRCTYLSEVNFIRIFIAAFLLILSAASVQAADYLPQSFQFSMNFYNVYGDPNLTAIVAGSNEFESGESATLFINLMNNGKISGFESVRTPNDENEIKLAEIEKNYESQRTLAIGVLASLDKGSAPIELQSGPQLAGSLREGEKTQTPMQFKIKVNEDAPAGIYKLRLNLTYDTQYNVQVSGNATRGDVNVNYWYRPFNQTQIIEIKIKKRARFEVYSNNTVMAGEKNKKVAFKVKNIGEATAENIHVILRADYPFTPYGNSYYIESLDPNTSQDVFFYLDVDSMGLELKYNVDLIIQWEEEGNQYTKTKSSFIYVEKSKPVEFSALWILPAGIVIAIPIALWLKRKNTKV